MVRTFQSLKLSPNEQKQPIGPSQLARLDDIRLSSEVKPEEILGGRFLPSIKRFAEAIQDDWPLALQNLRPQHVLVDFTEADFVDVFRLEGLAYDYWRANAKMRAVGKGSLLAIRDGEFYEYRSDEFAELLQRYDRRTPGEFNASLMGMSFHAPDPKASVRAGVIMVPAYNVDRHKMLDKLLVDMRTGQRMETNFVFGRLQLAEYVRAHAFAADAFKASRGWSFQALCQVLYTIAMAPLYEMSFASNEDERRSLLIRYLQRAYMTFPSVDVPMSKYIRSVTADISSQGGMKYSELPDDELSAIIEHLTLSAGKQDKIALWTHGPRPLFIPHGDALIVDLHAVPAILNTLFVGVRYSGTERGYRFEEAFRETVSGAKYELLPNRILRTDDGQKRETDAAIRVGSTLVLFDCRSIERPLDYEIGKPKTIASRVAFLREKLEQVRSIGDFIRANKRGANYDFSWAQRIVSAGVSPFVEWVWSLDDSLWLDKSRNLPIIMSVTEALGMLRAFSRRKKARRAPRKPRRRKKP